MPGLKRRGLETERQTGVTVTGVAQPTGKPAEHEGPRTYHTGEATAPVPDPTQAAGPAASGTRLVDPWPEGPQIVDAPDDPVVGLLLAATELGVALVGVRGS
jgi:hypothetical protein